MNRDKVLRYVAQEDGRGKEFRALFGADWVTVDASIKGETEDIGMGAAILPPGEVEHALGNADWDLLDGRGVPGFCTIVRPDREPVTTYHRFGSESGIEPLIIHRSFWGARPPSREPCEEFRLFHNLCPSSSEFIRFVDNGHEEAIVRMTPDRVLVRRRELMEYITAKGMLLAFYIDRFRYGMIEPVLRDDERIIEDKAEADMVYSFHRSDARRIGYKDRNV